MKQCHSIFLNLILLIGLACLSSSTVAAVGGLTYGYTDWPSNANYFNMDQKLRIDTAPLSNLNQGYFWSFQFYIGQAVGYFGLQQLPDGRKILNGAIWDTTNGSAAAGFTASPFGGEGVGIRVYGPYSWVPGRTYRLRIWELSPNWWGFYIQDTVTGVDTYVGKIENQFDPGKKLSGSVTFTEQFSGPDTCADAAAVRSTWFTPTANNGTVSALSVVPIVSYSDHVSQCGNQIVSVINKIKKVPVNQQIVCTGGAKANLLGVPSCWRYGSLNQSCQTVCATNGIDTTYWPNGQNLNNSQCSLIQSEFGNSNNVINATWRNNGAGCMSYHNSSTPMLYNIVNPSWSASYKNSIVKRFCGCAG